jgi:hypothetical protein
LSLIGKGLRVSALPAAICFGIRRQFVLGCSCSRGRATQIEQVQRRFATESYESFILSFFSPKINRKVSQNQGDGGFALRAADGG